MVIAIVANLVPEVTDVDGDVHDHIVVVIDVVATPAVLDPVLVGVPRDLALVPHTGPPALQHRVRHLLSLDTDLPQSDAHLLVSRPNHDGKSSPSRL